MAPRVATPPPSLGHQEQRAASREVGYLRPSLGAPWLTRSAASGSPASRCTQPTLKLTLAGGSETLEKRCRAQSQSPRATACAPWCQSRSRSPSEGMAEWTPPGTTRKSALPGWIAAGGREGRARGVLVSEDRGAGARESGDQRGPRDPSETDRGGEDLLRSQVLGAGGAERGAPGASSVQGRQVRQVRQEGPQAPPS